MNKTYQVNKKQENKNTARAAYALGFPKSAIACALGVTPATVTKYVAGIEAPPKLKRFELILRRYTEQFDENQVILRNMIEEYLGVEDMLHFVEGLEYADTALHRCEVETSTRPYLRLATKVLGERKWNLDLEDHLRTYTGPSDEGLRELTRKAVLYEHRYSKVVDDFFPKTRNQWKNRLAMVLCNYDQSVNTQPAVLSPGFCNLVKEVMSEVLEPLPDRVRYVIEHRFGIDCKPMTLKELGRDLSISASRVLDLENNGLRRLKHPYFSRRIRRLLRCHYDTEIFHAMECYERQQKEECDRKDEEFRRAEVERTSLQRQVAMNQYPLNTPVDELEISIRTSNVLKNADIYTIGDLVKYQEADLLKVSNFGRWCLNEIKPILAQYGLHLGMYSK